MPRTFRTNDGRTVTLPQGLAAGPGATNMRLNPGAVVTLEDDAKCVEFSRFINGRVRAGDWTEIDPKDAPSNPTPHAYVDKHDKPSMRPTQLVTGAKKED